MSDKEQWVDPPSGWKYGFPKVVPKEVLQSDTMDMFSVWLISCGYPKKDIDMALKYSRWWVEEKG